MENPSATAYDDSFRTLLNDCRELIAAPYEEYTRHHAHPSGDARRRDGI